MFRTDLIILSLLFFALPGYALFEESPSGARTEGMAGAFVAVADDINAIGYNPAGLAQVNSRQFQSGYKLLYGGVGVNLHTADAALSMPIGRFGTIGLWVQETGFQLQSQRSVKLTHGFWFAENLAFGYGLNGYNLYQGSLGQGLALGFDLGLWTKIARYWRAGFYAHNINMPKIGVSELPNSLTIGFGFSPKLGINSAVDVSKVLGERTSVSFGQEFEIIASHLILRAGVKTEPVRFSFGLTTGLQRFVVNYALITHPVLPLTHHFGLRLNF